jgi:hypothetical protein
MPMPRDAHTPSQKASSTNEPIALILEDINAQQQAWRRFLTSPSPEQATEPAGGPWSATDSLVHITAWAENGLRVARLQAQPHEPDPGPTCGLGLPSHQRGSIQRRYLQRTSEMDK